MTSSRGSTASVIEVGELTIVGPAGPIVRDFSLGAGRGETVAIVGESGSGKSLAARALTGLLPAGLRATGTVRIDRGPEIDLATARDADWRGIRGRRIALLLQDPFASLSPVRRVGTQIADTVRAHAGRRVARAEVRAAVLARLSEVRLPDRVARQYPHELSGGMLQRAALAAVLAADPEVLVADEPTTALDASTQGEILSLIDRLKAERGLAVVLISHDLDLVRGHADAVEVLFAGSVVERGPSALVIGDPAHPYTAGLLAAAPSIDRRSDRLPSRPWVPTGERELPEGFVFGAGYALAEEIRAADPPRLHELGGGRSVALYDAAGTLPRPVPPVPPVPVTASALRPESGQTERVLEVDRLAKRFDGRTVLDGVSLHVAQGEILGVVGESGSGKTTLARCIVGLEHADGGEIVVAHVSGTGRRGASGAQIVFQDPTSALNPAHTVGFALREVLRIAGDDPERAGGLLEQVGLPRTFLTRRPRYLSGGQRQRVAIARSLALSPSLLICDESVSALDVSVQAQILALLRELRDQRGLAILFISHDLGVINQLADRVVVLDGGRVVEEGATERVLGAPQHPYTLHLLAAARSVSARAEQTEATLDARPGGGTETPS